MAWDIPHSIRLATTLRSHGAGHHWIERYRGDIFVFVSDAADEAILRNEFSGLLDAVDDTETNGTRDDERRNLQRESKIETGI